MNRGIEDTLSDAPLYHQWSSPKYFTIYVYVLNLSIRKKVTPMIENKEEFLYEGSLFIVTKLHVLYCM